MAQQHYPEVERLKQVQGVGTLIALTFVLTVDNPHRFRRSRDLAATRACAPAGEILERASHNCTSAKKATVGGAADNRGRRKQTAEDDTETAELIGCSSDSGDHSSGGSEPKNEPPI